MNAEINERDLISMKLLHYFITKKNYNPIIVQGVENEIWLENLDADVYKVIRIVNNYIHNDEQLDFDVFKTKRMVKKIKKKTYTFKIKTLSILTDVGENASRDREFPDVDIVFYENENALVNNSKIKEAFPDLGENLVYSEEGFELFLKITDDINKKNRKVTEETDHIFEPKKPIITYILLGFIALVFLLKFVINPDYLTYYLGLNKHLVQYGEVYRLISNVFLHVDIIHLLTNMYSLYIIGKMTESYYGKKKYILIFLISALGGSLLSIAMNDGFSIGASGAIFGLLGSLIYFGYHYRVYFGQVLLNQIIPIVIINLFIGFMVPGIDNFAHIGGLIAGFLISKAVGINSKDKASDKINGYVLTVIYFAFLIFLVFFMG